MSNEKDNQGSFVEHLTELRSRLLKSIAYFFVFFIISYFFAENIYTFLVEPYAKAVENDPTNRRLIYTALHETFITYLKVAFFSSIFITSPIILKHNKYAGASQMILLLLCPTVTCWSARPRRPRPS